MKYFFFILLFLLTSCVELIDEIQLNNDGSGKFKYVINLSQSRSNVSSMLLLDSINGKKNLKLPEIKQKINSFKLTLAKQEGISNVIVVENYTDYSFSNKLSLKSKSGMAIMTKVTPNELVENPYVLDNNIVIKN